MKAKSLCVLMVLSFALFLTAGSSQGVVIDFESTPLGPYNALAFPDVNFSALPDVGYQTAELNVRDFSSIGYGHVLSTNLYDLQIIVAQFSSPINYLQIENPLHGPEEIDVITASAYDSGNNFLGTVTQSPGDQFLTLSFANMSKVLFNDVAGDWGAGYVIDNVTFNAAVPEPATMLLLGFGLIGFFGFRRKLRK